MKVYSTQSILDICIQSTGTIESLFDMLKLNNMNDLKIGMVQELNTIQPIKKRTVAFFKANNILTATDINRKKGRSFSSDFSRDFN